MPRVWLIGHRGAAGLCPENTLAGFERALDIGVNGIELDIMTTADGELCVYHDYRLKPEITRTPAKEWLDRAADIPIRSLTYKELRTYDVGRLRPHTEYARKYPNQLAIDGERIPLLRQVIKLLQARGDPRTQLWIEIKVSPEQPEMTPPYETVVERVLGILTEENFMKRAVVLSFNWHVLALVQQLAPRIPTAYLSVAADWLDNIKAGVPGPSPWTAGVDLHDFQGSIPHGVHAAGGKIWAAWFKDLTHQEVQAAHGLGLKVLAWFVDTRPEMEKSLSMGVDGIITNRPDRGREVLRGC